MDDPGVARRRPSMSPLMRAAPTSLTPDRSGPFPRPASIVEHDVQPDYGIAAVVTDGSLRAFCTLCPWWSRDVGRSFNAEDDRQTSYARARSELTRHILTPAHAQSREPKP